MIDERVSDEKEGGLYIHEYFPESYPIQGPQNTRTATHNTRSPRRIIHQSQLTKTPPRSNIPNLVPKTLLIPSLPNIKVKIPFLDNIKEITHVALMNDYHSILRDPLLRHTVKDIASLFVIEVLEEKVGGDGGADTGFLLCGFGGVATCSARGGGLWGEGFGADGRAATEVVVGWEVGGRIRVLREKGWCCASGGRLSAWCGRGTRGAR